MLRALGNICSGPDDFSLTACENPRLMPALLELLKAPLPHIARETLWVLSNMTSKLLVNNMFMKVFLSSWFSLGNSECCLN